MAETYGLMRKGFRIMNRFFMVPAFRLGLGPILGSPYGGYIMVIKYRGHKTGKIRYTPVNYAIANGHVYCIAGFGKVSHWVHGMTKDPEVDLLLPGRTVAVKGEVVKESVESISALRQILVNSGFAAYVFGGMIPSRVSEEKLRELTREYIVWRFTAYGIGAGPFDPSGWFWVWPLVALIALIWWLLK